jgi:probable O-glycosylation ligase (exosortase A-associated)
MRDIILVIVVFGALPFILMRPHLGVLMWSWIGYMNPHRLTWGFAYNFPFAYVVAVATILGTLFTREPRRLPWTPVTAVLVLFILWMSITTVFALEPYEAYNQLKKVIKIQLIVFIALMVMGQRERLHGLVWVIVVSIGFYGVKGGLFTLLTGGRYHVLGPEGSFIAGNTEIGLALVMIFPLIRYLQLTTENKWVYRGLTVGMILVAAAIAGTQSRGAFLGGTAMGIFLFIRGRQNIFIGLVILLVSLAIYKFMPDTWHERMSTIQTYEQDQGSAVGRLKAWRFSFDTAMARFFGGGFSYTNKENYWRFSPQIATWIEDTFGGQGGWVAAHSIYFGVLGEHGFIGLALFLILLVLTWRTSTGIIRKTKNLPHLKWAYDMASMVQVSLMGYIVAGTFLSLAYFDLTYQLMVILVLTNILVDNITEPDHKAVTESDHRV